MSECRRRPYPTSAPEYVYRLIVVGEKRTSWLRPVYSNVEPIPEDIVSVIEVWYNPGCSKSREAKQDLDSAGVGYVLRNYLDLAPSVRELDELTVKLGCEPWQLCRTDDPTARELGMGQWPTDTQSRARWLEALHEHPGLIQRPIAVQGDRAVVARGQGWLEKLS